MHKGEEERWEEKGFVHRFYMVVYAFVSFLIDFWLIVMVSINFVIGFSLIFIGCTLIFSLLSLIAQCFTLIFFIGFTLIFQSFH